MNICLVHAPFCTPVSPPYGLAYLYSFLKQNLDSTHKLSVVDANLKFHNIQWPNARQNVMNTTIDTYADWAKQFMAQTKETYAACNKQVLNDQKPLHLQQVLDAILETKPDVVLFSIIYNSQMFYTKALTDELRARGIATIAGGPCATPSCGADKVLPNEVALLETLTGNKVKDHYALKANRIVDYSPFKDLPYIAPEYVIPLKTTNTCYYQKCTFCTHHTGQKYKEYDLDDIVESIKLSGAKRIFFVDDMIHKQRLLKLSEAVKPLRITWMCQLRPTIDLDEELFTTMYDSGCRDIIFGVESGCDRILKLMKKGTNTKDVAQVLKASKASGITTCIYLMFGFPTETKEELMQSLQFIEDNKDSIDLISTATFGLQEGAPIMDKPADYGITNIRLGTRKLLSPKVSYESNQGLSNKEAATIKRKHTKQVRAINKLPHQMNFFREHLLHFTSLE